MSTSISQLATSTRSERVEALERAAVAHLGHGPVLVVDSNDLDALHAVRARQCEVAVFDSRSTMATRAGAAGFASFKVGMTELHYRENFASIILGTGVHEQGEHAFEARLTQTLLWLAPAGRLVICLPAAFSINPEIQALIRSHVLSADLQVRSQNLSFGDELVLITKRLDRSATVRIDGSLDGELDGSLALVNAALATELLLDSGGVRMTLAGQSETAPPDIVIRHGWPARFARPQTRHYIHMQPWEFGTLPAEWHQNLAQVDEIWCYTRYVADIYARAGFPRERLHIMPLGFHPTDFSPSAAPEFRQTREETCIFTFVGGLIRRKGADLAVAAFARAFTAADNVCLVIKVTGASTFYSQQAEDDTFAALRDMRNPPRCVISDTHYSNLELATLYRSTTALIAPFRGEGFGLPALEAMACGTPVVYTAGGAMDDFIPPDLGYPIPSIARPVHRDSLSTGPMIGDGFLLEPDAETLAAKLREIYEHRQQAWVRGARAAAAVHNHLTWHHAAKRVQFRLRQIAEELGLSL